MPNQIQSYQKVIDVIADVHFDHDARAILLQIAKTNPQIVVAAAEYLKGAPVTTYGVSNAVMDALFAGQKIQAIKQHRTDSGLGLKEAKDAIDNVITQDARLWGKFGRRSDGSHPYP